MIWEIAAFMLAVLLSVVWPAISAFVLSEGTWSRTQLAMQVGAVLASPLLVLLYPASAIAAGALGLAQRARERSSGLDTFVRTRPIRAEALAWARYRAAARTLDKRIIAQLDEDFGHTRRNRECDTPNGTRIDRAKDPAVLAQPLYTGLKVHRQIRLPSKRLPAHYRPMAIPA